MPPREKGYYVDHDPGRPGTSRGAALGPLPVPRILRRAVDAATAMRGTRRLEWLNAAGDHIGTTLDLDRTAQELADYAVPALADAVAVDLLESLLRGGEGERTGSAEAPRTRAMAVAHIDRLRNLEPDPVGELTTAHPSKVAHQCLITRRPALVRRIAPDQYEYIAPTSHAALVLRRAGVHSYLALPLVSRGVLLGLVDFLRSGDRPPFSHADVALACELAAKAAVFVDNARLYGRERTAVVTLQRALLPRAAPSTPGLQVRSGYRPAVDPGGVGGDWFDVVALPSGRSALVVGDVMGHGLAAAATMGRLRSVARTLLGLDISPERVLARLDLAARDLEEDQVATCLCAVYDHAERTYRMASAGHLPPLMIDAAGRAAFLDVPPGAPLGAGVIPYDEVTTEVPEGSRLVMYTDGLIKNRYEDIDVLLERLRAAVDGPPVPLSDSCEAAWTRTDSCGDGRFDDAVMLMAEALPRPDADVVVWSLPANGSAAGTARRLVRAQLERWALSDLMDVTELVVSELVGNALRYGGGPTGLRLLRHDRLCVEVSDIGPDLPRIQHAPLSAEGGRGLQLINMLCRRWGSCRTPGGKVVWAEQDLPGGGSRGGG
ncbi:ATP-binding SpoIIE family protein phosphatase [Streptomyces bacillaris]|uniref:ATP-binding SpoIIE family protein phosphatase n=2 Tax=Streptomyces TaxID=1883 RepID=UPI00082383E7|nr:SpoIIE family protein phosphatase [Streptomyces sp. SID8350]NGO86958.1 SpoIIE family protein phosphatase [Streptomyces sp. 196(2019)]SCK13469.1 GAF domain-containing protein [Streptomyces sp. AmelKG-D3]